MFNLLPGSTLRNVVIGKHQAEGVHALGDAWVENVWWEDVCEDALTSKGLNTQLRVIGGGARNATDKVETQAFCFYSRHPTKLSTQIFQDNSLGGKFNITGFYADTFGSSLPFPRNNTLPLTFDPTTQALFTRAVGIA